MAWLNLNNSINSLKGQITNLATDLLSEGIIQSSDIDENAHLDNDSRVQELENLVCAQKIEIKKLKEQNEDLTNKLCKNNELLLQQNVQNIQESSTTTRKIEQHENDEHEHEWTMFDNEFGEEEVNEANYVDNNININNIDLQINKNINKINELNININNSTLNNNDNVYKQLIILYKLNEQLFNYKFNCIYKHDNTNKVPTTTTVTNQKQQHQQDLLDLNDDDDPMMYKKELKLEIDKLKDENKRLLLNEDEIKMKLNELCDLNDKLNLENVELKLNLQQLDQDCLLTTDKLVTLRDTLQQDFNKIQMDYNQLYNQNNQLQQQLHNYEKEFDCTRKELDVNLMLKNKYESQLNGIITILNQYTNTKFNLFTTDNNNDNDELKLKIMELITTSNKNIQNSNTTKSQEIQTQTEVEADAVDDDCLAASIAEEKLNNKLKETTNELKRLKNDLDFYKSECEQLRKNNENLFEDLKLLQENVNLETIIETNEEELYQKYEQQLQELNTKYTNIIQDKDNTIQDYIQKLHKLQDNYNDIDLQLQKQIQITEQQNNNLIKIQDLNTNKQENIIKLQIELNELQNKLQEIQQQNKNNNNNIRTTTTRHDVNIQTDNDTTEDVIKLKQDYNELLKLINLKHDENHAYHSEIQRLNQLIMDNKVKHEREYEQLHDHNEFLQQKCDVLTKQLLEQQSNIQHEQQQIQQLLKELERLRQHLLHIEDAHAQEMLENEQKCKELRNQIMEMEQRERDNSTIYTSVSIRANQQVETLQKQIQLANEQRNEYERKLNEVEDEQLKQSAALTNLQCVLEQFQKDKEKEILEATLFQRKELEEQLLINDNLYKDIDMLRLQLNEAKEGLKAAARLQEQLEKARHQVCSYQDEVNKLNGLIKTHEEQAKEFRSHAQDKVDKTLIKNLFMGYLQTNNTTTTTTHRQDTQKILKIIGTVLDFNQNDYEKILMGTTSSSSWYQTIMKPSSSSSSSKQDASDEQQQQSLSEAFIKFLENESQPKPVKPPLLLVNNNTNAASNNQRKNSSASEVPPPAVVVDLNTTTTSGGKSNASLLLNDVLLPTFEDFAHTRSSSSILKDVLNNK